MATKTNIRSIRMSDQVMEYIEAQVGENFTQKFEAMVLRCMWELPVKEEELKRLDGEIIAKRKQLYAMMDQVGKLEATINKLFPQVRQLEESIARAVHDWKV